MLQAGFISPNTSPWEAQILFVKKKRWITSTLYWLEAIEPSHHQELLSIAEKWWLMWPVEGDMNIFQISRNLCVIALLNFYFVLWLFCGSNLWGCVLCPSKFWWLYIIWIGHVKALHIAFDDFVSYKLARFVKALQIVVFDFDKKKFTFEDHCHLNVVITF